MTGVIPLVLVTNYCPLKIVLKFYYKINHNSYCLSPLEFTSAMTCPGYWTWSYRIWYFPSWLSVLPWSNSFLSLPLLSFQNGNVYLMPLYDAFNLPFDFLQVFTAKGLSLRRDFGLGVFSSDGTCKTSATLQNGLNEFYIMRWT